MRSYLRALVIDETRDRPRIPGVGSCGGSSQHADLIGIPAFGTLLGPPRYRHVIDADDPCFPRICLPAALREGLQQGIRDSESARELVARDTNNQAVWWWLRFEGSAVAWGTLPLALGIGILGALVALALGRLSSSIRLLGSLLEAASKKPGGQAARTATAELERRASV